MNSESDDEAKRSTSRRPMPRRVRNGERAIPFLTGSQRIEVQTARIHRLRRTLLGYYQADLKYQEIIESDSCRKWADRSEQSYRELLNRIVITELRLTNRKQSSEPLGWAISALDVDVRTRWPLGRSLFVSPSISAFAYPSVSEFRLSVSPSFLRFEASWLGDDDGPNDIELELTFGDAGWGDEAWEALRQLVLGLVDDSVDELRRSFEETFEPKVKSLTRPTTIDNQMRALGVLYRYLFHMEPPLTEARRAQEVARELGVHWPRK